MAGIRVCLPGKRTAVVSVTPLEVKDAVGHADHSKEATTTLNCCRHRRAGRRVICQFTCTLCMYHATVPKSSQTDLLDSPGNNSNVSTCLPGRHTATVLITPLKVQNHVGRSGEQYSKPTR